MALVVWGVLLVLLIQASGFVAQAAALNTRFLNMSFITQADESPILGMIIFGAFLLLAGITLLAWARFFIFSRRMFVSFSRKREPEEPSSIFLDFLHFQSPQERLDPENASGSAVGRIISLLGVTIILSMLTYAAVVLILPFWLNR